MRQKLTCGKCNTTDYPAFDGQCRFCASALPENKDGAVTKTSDKTENEIRECTACATEINEGEQFCTGCGAEAPPVTTEVQEEPVAPHCTFCGLDIEESTEVCPRCDETIAVEAKDDDEDDDDEDDDDEKRKELEDKAGAAKKKKHEDTAREVVLTPTEEAQFYIAIASQLDEEQVRDLAAHIVWGAKQEEINTPRWLPDEYKDDWNKALAVGRPKTMLGAVSYLSGVIGSRG